jgi:predicted O-methyltransferase YrrM
MMRSTLLLVLAFLLTAQISPAQPPGGSGRPKRRPNFARAPIENPLLAQDEAEAKALKALAEAREGPRYANISEDDGRLMRLLTESIGAKHVVEIGTSTGESGIWFAIALRKTGGKLVTHEIDPERAKVAEANFKKAGVDDVISIVVGDAHETVKQIKDPIDILFLDADKAGYIDYLEKLMPLVRPGGLIVAHNMVYPPPDPDYLKAVTQDPKLETSFLLMAGAGVGVTLKKR